MSTSESWNATKEKGNKLYSLGHYKEALTNYVKAIELLQATDDNNNNSKEELAKLYSNKSVTLSKIALTKAGKSKLNDLLQDALADGLKCLSLDPGFQKGYFRVGDALCQLGRQKEAVQYVDKLLEAHKRKNTKYEDDNHLLDLMRHCKYYAHVKESSPHWSKVKFKDNCLVVDPHGAGDIVAITEAELAFNTKVSFLVRPGKYLVKKELIIFPEKEVDIVADVKNGEEAIFYSQGKVFSPETCHIFIAAGKLSLNLVTVKQMSDHPEMHAVLGNMKATVELTDVKGYSKCSACIAMVNSNLKMKSCTFDEACGAIILSTRTTADIKLTKIMNNARMGIELRDKAYANIEDCEIVNCGHQAVTSHAGATGFKLKRCILHNNSKFMAGEPSVSVAAGKVTLTDCQLTGSNAGGVIVHDGADATIEKCCVAGGGYGIGFSLKGTGRVKECDIRNVHFGISVLFNLKAEVVLENNRIVKSGTEVLLTEDDVEPVMVGKQHKVTVKSEADMNQNRFASQIGGVEKARKKDKPRPGSRYEDPRKRAAHTERACKPCGFSQSTLGTTFMVCSGCKVAWYCSKACQKKDWPIHKEECKKTRAQKT